MQASSSVCSVLSGNLDYGMEITVHHHYSGSLGKGVRKGREGMGGINKKVCGRGKSAKRGEEA